MRYALVITLILALAAACGGGDAQPTPEPSFIPLEPGVYRIPPGGSEAVLLADGRERYAVSRDGRWLAFQGNGGVSLADLEDGGAPVAAARFQEVYGLAVPPDGRSAAVYGRLDTVKGIYVLDAATGAVTKPVPIRSNEPGGAIEWSPTGDAFAFTGAPGDGPAGLYVCDPSTWETTLLFETRPDALGRFIDAGPRPFDWSADGTTLAIASPYGSDPGLFVIDVGSGGVRKVSDGVLSEGRLTVSPNGRRLAYSTGPVVGPDRGVVVQQPQLLLVDAESGREAVLTEGHDPAWSPDGSEIAFVRNGGLYVIGADGEDERRIGPYKEPVYHPEWLADGSLVFTAGGVGY